MNEGDADANKSWFLVVASISYHLDVMPQALGIKARHCSKNRDDNEGGKIFYGNVYALQCTKLAARIKVEEQPIGGKTLLI